MNFFRKFGVFTSLLISLVPAQLFAAGYSEYENHKIWQLRLAAEKYAAQTAQKKCAWTPESPNIFSDEWPTYQTISNKRLSLRIATMIRLDQNARAISMALTDNKTASAKTGEVDSDNLIALKNIFSEYGFPTREEVGEFGTNAMLMLVAHADSDFEFQKSVALRMDDEVAKGELPAIYPTILKVIRPQIAGASGNSNNSSHDTGLKFRSPRECYAQAYQAFIDSYTRRRACEIHLGVCKSAR